MFVQIDWDTAKIAKKYKKQVKKERIYDFLVGLVPELDEVWGGIKPTLTIDEIFAEVRRKASRKHVMLGDSKQPSLENLALAAVEKNQPMWPRKILAHGANTIREAITP